MIERRRTPKRVWLVVGGALVGSALGAFALLSPDAEAVRPGDHPAGGATARSVLAATGPLVPTRLDSSSGSRASPSTVKPAVVPKPAGVATPAFETAKGAPAFAGNAELAPIAARLALPDARSRRHALREIPHLSDPAAGAELARGSLRDADPSVRAEAAYVLGTLRDPGATSALVAALSDADDAVRYQALDALWRTGDPAAADALKGLLASSDTTTQRKALRALAALGNPDASVVELEQTLIGNATTVLGDQAASSSVDARKEAVKTIRDLGDVRQLPLLEQAAGDPDPSVREKVAEGLGRLGGVRAVPFLQSLLNDPDRGVRHAAKRALDTLPGS